MMNFSKSFIHYSKVFQSGPTNEANVLIEIKYDVGKTTAEPPRTTSHAAGAPHTILMSQRVGRRL
jgi:hypothetical protein